MKHRLILLLLLGLFLPAAFVQAKEWQDFTECDAVIDGIAYRLDNEKLEAAVTFFSRKNDVIQKHGFNYTCHYEHNYGDMQYRGDVVIPEKVELKGQSYTVTSIDTHAFDGCKEMTGLQIPQSVYYDFHYWLSERLKNEKDYEGYERTWAYKYENGDLVTYSRNGDDVDYNYYKDPFPWLLEKAAGSVIYQGDDVALVVSEEWTNSDRNERSTVHIDAVSIKDEAKAVKSKAFYKCDIGDVALDNVTVIGDSAFFEAKLGNISMPNVEKIGICAFCSSNLKALDQTPFLKTIDECAFSGCTSLTDVTLPNSLRTIGYGAFSGCGIKEIVIPYSVSRIDSKAFLGCSNLERATIPVTVEDIGSKAFPKTEITITGNGECTYLKKIFQYAPTFVNVGCGITGVDRIYSNVERVNSYPETPPTISEYVDWNTSPGELHVPASALAAYFTAPDWQKFTSMKGDLVGRVKLEQTEALMLKDDELQLSAASVAPEGSALVWGTTNPDVATVDENGKVTATGVGECDIYASLADNLAIYTACHIDVHNRVAIALPAEALTARLNTIVAVTPTFDPEPTDITVTSSDPAVAIARLINAPAGAAAHAPVTGPKIFQVLGLKQGQAVITVASADGISQPASINVTVIDNYPQGDVDCNRVVNGSDVTALYNSLLDDTAGPAGAPAIFTTRLDGTPLLDADVDGNGVVNGSDVTALYNLLLK